jgi:hypothetical protein
VVFLLLEVVTGATYQEAGGGQKVFLTNFHGFLTFFSQEKPTIISSEGISLKKTGTPIIKIQRRNHSGWRELWNLKSGPYRI